MTYFGRKRRGKQRQDERREGKVGHAPCLCPSRLGAYGASIFIPMAFAPPLTLLTPTVL